MTVNSYLCSSSGRRERFPLSARNDHSVLGTSHTKNKGTHTIFGMSFCPPKITTILVRLCGRHQDGYEGQKSGTGVEKSSKRHRLGRSDRVIFVPPRVVNTTPNPRIRRTPAHVIFYHVAQGSGLESSKQQESLCLTKQSFFTSSTGCLTRPRCLFLHT